MRYLLPLLALPLAACGGGTAPTGNTAAPAVESEFQKKVTALEPAARDGVFIRAIRDAGFDCQQVTESAAVAGKPGAWSARCSDGAGYGVQIGSDGTAQVIGARSR